MSWSPPERREKLKAFCAEKGWKVSFSKRGHKEYATITHKEAFRNGFKPVADVVEYAYPAAYSTSGSTCAGGTMTFRLNPESEIADALMTEQTEERVGAKYIKPGVYVVETTLDALVSEQGCSDLSSLLGLSPRLREEDAS